MQVLLLVVSAETLQALVRASGAEGDDSPGPASLLEDHVRADVSATASAGAYGVKCSTDWCCKGIKWSVSCHLVQNCGVAEGEYFVGEGEKACAYNKPIHTQVFSCNSRETIDGTDVPVGKPGCCEALTNDWHALRSCDIVSGCEWHAASKTCRPTSQTIEALVPSAPTLPAAPTIDVPAAPTLEAPSGPESTRSEVSVDEVVPPSVEATSPVTPASPTISGDGDVQAVPQTVVPAPGLDVADSGADSDSTGSGSPVGAAPPMGDPYDLLRPQENDEVHRKMLAEQQARMQAAAAAKVSTSEGSTSDVEDLAIVPAPVSPRLDRPSANSETGAAVAPMPLPEVDPMPPKGDSGDESDVESGPVGAAPPMGDPYDLLRPQQNDEVHRKMLAEQQARMQAAAAAKVSEVDSVSEVDVPQTVVPAPGLDVADSGTDWDSGDESDVESGPVGAAPPMGDPYDLLRPQENDEVHRKMLAEQHARMQAAAANGGK